MLIPHGTLILAVDGAHLQLLRNRGSDALPALDRLHERKLKNPASHVLETDAPGRAFSSAGHGRSAYDAPDLHQRREDRFSHEALEQISSMAGEETPVILIAPPHVLGEIRADLDPRSALRIIAEINKDYAQSKPAEILELLRNYQP
jgi:protein required for attachment to host cells